MQLTDYQPKYSEHKLTTRYILDSVEKITVSLIDKQLNLNSQQIEARLKQSIDGITFIETECTVWLNRTRK